MTSAEELGNIINFMLNDCPEREDAEKAYLQIAETSPFTLIEYHFFTIESNIQNQIAILRSLTLLKRLFQHFENFDLSAEQHQFIQEKFIEIFSNGGLSEQNRILLTSLIDLAQQTYNRQAVAQQGELLWTSIFPECLKLSGSENELISYSAIKLISHFIKFGSFPVAPNLDFLNALITHNFTIQDFNMRIISTIELILSLYTEVKTYSQYAPYILNMFPSVPYNRAKLYCSIIFNIRNIGFFFDVIPNLVSIFSTALQDENYSVDVRVTIMEIFGMYISSNTVLQNYPADTFFEIVKASLTVLTTIESDENKYLSTSAKSLLGNMSDKINLDDFDNSCLELALECIGKEEWQFRFAGLSLIHSICSHINDESVTTVAELLKERIQDPVAQSRKVVYKIMKVIAKHKRYLFDSSLSGDLFPLLLAAIPLEQTEDEENAIYAFSVLSVFCHDSQADTLGQFAEPILNLCFSSANGSSESMILSILKCIGSLCVVMTTNIHPFLEPITQFLGEASKIGSLQSLYQTALTIHECLDMCVNDAEKATFSQFGLEIFNHIDWEQTGQVMRLNLFKAFRSFAKNLGSSNVPQIGTIIDELVQSSSAHVKMTWEDDVDFSLLPKEYAVIRMNERILLINTQEIYDIVDSIEILTDFVRDFPEYFGDGKTNVLFGIISDQIGGTNNYMMVSSVMLLLKALIEKSDVLNPPVEHFLLIMSQFVERFENEKSLILLVSVMKYFIVKFVDPAIFTEIFTLSTEILKQSYNKEDEIYADLTQIPQDNEYETSQAKEQIESSYEQAKLLIMELAKFYSFLINKFPDAVSPEFLQNLVELFSEDKPSRFKLPRFLINVRAESFTSKNYLPYISLLDKYINEDYPEECEFVMEVINLIVQDAIDPNVLAPCLELITKLLQFKSIENIEFDKACNLAIYCLVCIMRKIPESASIPVLQMFHHLLPVTNFDFNAEEDESIRAIEIHEYFANDIMNKNEFYTAAECLPKTLTIIAQLCNSDFINENTKTKFQQFVNTLLQQPEAQPSFQAIREKYFNRLTEFVKPSE